MGRSTVQQLINKGMGENGYNNSGIAGTNKWVDLFNDALGDLVDDLGLSSSFTVNFTGVRENDLPADYFEVYELYESSGFPVNKRRSYGSPAHILPRGYWVLNKGNKFVIDLFQYNNSQIFTGLYGRYAARLTADPTGLDAYPEIHTLGENGLPYYAIAKALRNNNQIGQAQDYEKLYQAERMKLRAASARARSV